MLKALDIITVQTRAVVKGIKNRRCKQIVEITGIDPRSGNIRINDMFKWNPQEDNFEEGSESYVMNNIIHEMGWSTNQLLDEMDNRKDILRYMVKNNIRDYKNFAKIIQAYFTDPQDVMTKLKNDHLKEFVKL